jgi:hypothetical protein
MASAATLIATMPKNETIFSTDEFPGDKMRNCKTDAKRRDKTEMQMKSKQALKYVTILTNRR